MQITSLIALSLPLVCFGAPAGNTSLPIWSYEGSTGPLEWQGQCKTGSRQSPINLDTRNASETRAFITERNSTALRLAWWDNLAKNASTLSLKNGLDVGPFETGMYTTTMDGKNYSLLQLHLHTPSEHRVEGNYFAMELHLVHRSVDDPNALLVLGVFMDIPSKETQGSPFMSTLTASLTGLQPNASVGVQLPLASFVADEADGFGKGFWTYAGSLTTPPCTESVQWVVAKDVVAVSAFQVNEIKNITGFNARVTMPRSASDLSAFGAVPSGAAKASAVNGGWVAMAAGLVALLLM